MNLAATYPVRSPATASRLVDGEAVVITLPDGVVRMFNPVGSRAWELVDGRRSAALIVEALAAEFDAERAALEADVAEFLADLAGRGLLTLAERPA